ncbi:MAG: type IV secretion system protein VirJ [Sphingomonadales bacterium]|nr:type IV secretion system protein VirJ [Sphingomonadales bacterium]
MRNRRAIRPLIAIIGLVALVLLTFGWLGYLGGNPFMVIRPQGYQAEKGAPVAVIFSGDMGFRVGMGTLVAKRLERDGIPVVGVNSLSYFRRTRTPAEAGALIREALAQARAINPLGRVVLIGQSFGADMLHVGLAQLPIAQRRGIALVALVVPGARVEFRASPGEILTFWINDVDALPTARQLDWVPLLCLHGVDEHGSLCPLLHQPNLWSKALPGGHQLNWDSEAVAREITSKIVETGDLNHAK